MVLAALIVAIISAALAGALVVYNRRLTRASERSADDSARSADAADRSAEAAAKSAEAAAATAALDADRRHSELTPRFRVTCQPAGQDGLDMVIFLAGPPELERLDALKVTIRDDHPWRGQRTSLADAPTPEQIAAQIWGRYRFVPGTGPGADSVRGIPGADPTGRTTATRGMPVGEELRSGWISSSRPGRRSVPRTAATCPRGRLRVISNARPAHSRPALQHPRQGVHLGGPTGSPGFPPESAVHRSRAIAGLISG